MGRCPDFFSNKKTGGVFAAAGVFKHLFAQCTLQTELTLRQVTKHPLG